MVLILGFSVAQARTALPVAGATKGRSVRQLDANAWLIKTTNFGPFVYPQSSSAGGFWGGPGYNYIYGAGLWVGGLDRLDTPRVAVGYNPASGGSEFGPADPYTWDWTNMSWDPRVRLYLSTIPQDVAEWPVKDDNGNNIIKSVQDCYGTYSDENPAFTFTGERKLGIRIKQWSYAWNYADNNDIVFFYFRVFNCSGDSLHNVYVGPCIDADIGNESTGTDRTSFDYTRNLAIQFQSTNEPGWPRTGVFGCRYFESPVNNTGDTVHVIDNEYAHDIPPGQRLGMTAFKVFTIAIDPSTDFQRYRFMRGWSGGMTPDAYDEWGDVTPGDKRFLMSSGPFHLGPNDSTTTCLGVMCAWDTAAVLRVSDIAQAIYDNGFQLAHPPRPPQITLIPGGRRAFLSWSKAAEAPDPYRAAVDSTPRWYVYFKGSYFAYGKHRVDTVLVDSFRIKTGPSTFAAIARGAANPAGGTDTLEAFYSQRAMYARDDFQGYLVYRADSRDGLLDPLRRTPVGTPHTGASGATGYFYDKADGVQIALDPMQIRYTTPDTVFYFPVYDTIGTDRGLAYALADTGLVNGRSYFYSLLAYDYQPNACFTRKCPVSSRSGPMASWGSVVPRQDPPGYIPPGVRIRVDGGCDARYGGSLDHFQNLIVADPAAVPDDSFKIRWQGTTRTASGSMNLPRYKGLLYTSGGVCVDSLTIAASYGYCGSDPERSFNGASCDQLPFGGIVFQPFVKWEPWLCLAETMAVITENPGGSRTYPVDSVRVRLDPNTFRSDVGMWMWRGSDFEIRWKDTIVNIVGQDTAALTGTVWDLTNNVEVPFECGLSKASMTKSGWCFNYISTISGADRFIYKRTSNDNRAIFIAGLTVFFNRTGGSVRLMDWANRPETGDVWRIDCSGPRPPVAGNVSTFSLSPQVPGLVGLTGIVAPLYQNAPNPFSESTVIGYQLFRPGNVSLRIYNIAGQLVRGLVETMQSTGVYAVRWDGRGDAGQKLSAGVYLYRLSAKGGSAARGQAGDKTMTRKLVLVR